MIKLTESELIRMRILENFVLIKPNRPNDEWHSVNSDLKLKIDTSYNPAFHVVRSGEIIKTPQRLSIKGNNPMEWKTIMEVEKKDVVYFDYLAAIQALGVLGNPVMSKNEENPACFMVKDQIYIFLHYSTLYTVVRNGIPIPVNGYVLVEPMGNPLKAPKLLILPDLRQKKHKEFEGRVLFVGSVNERYYDKVYHDAIEVHRGDHVYFSKYVDTPMEYEIHSTFLDGKTVFPVQRRWITAVREPKLSELTN